jgi:hypothetical protein
VATSSSSPRPPAPPADELHLDAVRALASHDEGQELGAALGDEQRVAATHAPRLSQRRQLAGGRRGPRAAAIGDEQQLLER